MFYPDIKKSLPQFAWAALHNPVNEPRYAKNGQETIPEPQNEENLQTLQINGMWINHNNIKTFPENWDSKAPSVGTLLAYLETTAIIIKIMAHYHAN